MKIFASVDSFKGTLSSKTISSIIEKELKEKGHEVIAVPISDGGDGFIDSLKSHFLVDGKFVESIDARGNIIECEYLLMEKVAYIEMNSSSGITKVKKQDRNPLKTSTYGVGLIIKNAIQKGAIQIILGLGGSSTNDGGAGMLQALGVKFYSKDGLITEHMNGHLIGDIVFFDTSVLVENIKDIEFKILCDVKNPLLGIQGCTYVYAPQKGAKPRTLKKLETAMTHFADKVEAHFAKKYRNIEGVGAAGGLGFGALAFLNTQMLSGITTMIEILDIETSIKNADVVIVGEGKLDEQTINGKAPSGIAQIAKKHNKKVIGIFGIIDYSIDIDWIDQIVSVVPKYASKNLSLAKPEYYLTQAIKDLEIK